MLATSALWRSAFVVLLSVLFSPWAVGQSSPPPPVQPEATRLTAGIATMRGTDAGSSIQWIMLMLEGKTVSGAAGTVGPPLLISQCTLRADNQYKYEMLASFGDAADLAFYPPWKQTRSSGPFPPALHKVTLTMEFLGYTHVKPLHRQFEIPLEAPGLFRYSPPGVSSSNLEEIAYDLRYFLALPMLRLSFAGRTAEFQTAPLLTNIRNEPLCRAARL